MNIHPDLDFSGKFSEILFFVSDKTLNWSLSIGNKFGRSFIFRNYFLVSSLKVTWILKPKYYNELYSYNGSLDELLQLQCHDNQHKGTRYNGPILTPSIITNLKALHCHYTEYNLLLLCCFSFC